MERPALSRTRAPRVAARRRYMVQGFCPLTGAWRELVHAASAAGAIAAYCAEHDMPPDNCQAWPD
jgi:hypothetical protein